MKSINKHNKLFIIIISSIAAIGGFLFGFDANDADPFSWRLMFHIGFIPGFMLFLGMFFLPETPYIEDHWSQGRTPREL